MLTIKVPISPEGWDDKKQEFIEPEYQTLQLEHSLVSLSKWESKWCKPFLSSIKSDEEMLDYIKCMTVTKNMDPNIYNYLTTSNVIEIKDYIDAPMTAMKFPNNRSSKLSRDIITSDIIYYWMITLNIPIDECQKWHLNRLMALIRVCDIKNSPPKKKSQREIMEEYARINAERRKQLNTKG